MNCETARMLMIFFGNRRSELTPEESSSLEAHLSSCSTCATQFQSEQSFNTRVAQVMQRIEVPANLKNRISDQLASQRGSWYRSRALVGIGLAASVVFSFGTYVGYQILTAPNLSAQALVSQEDRQIEDPASLVNRELSRHGLRYNPQRNFDLNQLATVGTSDLQGREVPMLYFRNLRKNSHAKVYVVNDRMFHWKGIDPENSLSHGKYGHQVAIIQDNLRGDVGYLVVFTGDSLDVFLETSSSP